MLPLALATILYIYSDEPFELKGENKKIYTRARLVCTAHRFLFSVEIKFEMFIDFYFPFCFTFYRSPFSPFSPLSQSMCVCACLLTFFAPCQRHLNLQILMNWGKWNQITTITMHANRNEAEINNKNQSIHLTWLIRFCFGKLLWANCQGK